MAMETMYPAKSGSPATFLTDGISSSADVIPVDDVTKLPDPPNLAILGGWEGAEVVLYTGKSGSTLTGCTRGFGDTDPQVWLENDLVARFLTAYDVNTLIHNIGELETALGAISLEAEAVSFDNTENDFTAVNVQTAIEEVMTAVEAVSFSAEEVSFTSTGLEGITATDVQNAISQLHGIVDSQSFSAVEISFNPAESDLESTDVQSAIQELESGLSDIVLDAENITFDPALSDLTSTTVQAAIEELEGNLPAGRDDHTAELRLEVRTDDPTSPNVGRIWLRSDL